MDIRPTTDGPQPDHVIVVYDVPTGAIRHVHQELTLPGGRAPSAAEVRERAVALARGMMSDRRAPARLGALAIGADDRALLRQRLRLRVDHASGRLATVGRVSTPRPKGATSPRTRRAVKRR
jgi:hypothetical protein